MTALKTVKRLLTRWERSDKARASRIRRAEDRDLPTWPRKSAVPCCAATRDEYGRLCIGWCGPDCERRPEPPLPSRPDPSLTERVQRRPGRPA